MAPEIILICEIATSPGADQEGARAKERTPARNLVIWGSGTPRREFLHVDDCGDALVHILKVYFGHGAHQCRIRRGLDDPLN